MLFYDNKCYANAGNITLYLHVRCQVCDNTYYNLTYAYVSKWSAASRSSSSNSKHFLSLQPELYSLQISPFAHLKHLLI